MGYTAIVGDRTTTTALAVASAWPGDDDVVVVEADPTGGSLAAWLGLPPSPSLSTAVARCASSGEHPIAADRWFRKTIATCLLPAGIGARVLAAPPSGREARRSVTEAGATILPRLDGLEAPAVLVDGGRLAAGEPLPVAVRLTRRVVLCHRQEPASASAASIRLRRLVETLESLTAPERSVIVAVIGQAPYGVEEIADFVDATLEDSAPTRRLRVVALADDPLSAAVLAGRTGVSARRLGRLPLMRTAADLAEVLRSQDRANVSTHGGRR